MTSSNRFEGAILRGGVLLSILLWLWGNSLCGLAEGAAARTKGGVARTKGGAAKTKGGAAKTKGSGVENETAADAGYGVEPGDNGTLVADLGFSPMLNGFGFENYGGDYPSGDLTAAEARQLFGDQVCEYVKGQTCFPTPAAQLWIAEMNQGMLNGHCEGMAALSLLFFLGEKKPADYGGAATAADFDPQNAALLREIARYWTLQTLEPVISESTKSQQKTPVEILDMIRAGLQPGGNAYTLGVYGKMGGHAITPYAVEEVGNGKFWVHVYDNNYPGAGKYVEIDTATNTWKYAGAAINPGEDAAPWGGGVGTLDLTSLAVRQQPLRCPFCGTGDSCDKPSALTLMVDGKGAAAKTKGAPAKTKGALPKELRLEQGRAVNEIPGAYITRMKGAAAKTKGAAAKTKGGAAKTKGDTDRPTLMILPPGLDYATTIRGETNTEPEPVTVSAFRACGTFTIEGLMLQPGKEDQLLISSTARDFAFIPGSKQSVTLQIATNSPTTGRNGLYVMKNVALGQGFTFSLFMDPAKDTVSVKGKAADGAEASNLRFDLEVTSVKGEDSKTSVFENVSVNAGEEFLMITNPDGSVSLALDANGDGTPDRSYDAAGEPAVSAEGPGGGDPIVQGMFDAFETLNEQAASSSIPAVGATGAIGLPTEGASPAGGAGSSQPQTIEIPVNIGNQ